MTSSTGHACDSNIVPAGHRDTVILICDHRIRENDVIRGREIESIRVMRSSERATGGIRGKAVAVVEVDACHEEAVGACHGEAVDGPVFDVEIGNDAVDDVLDDKEVVWSVQC